MNVKEEPKVAQAMDEVEFVRTMERRRREVGRRCREKGVPSTASRTMPRNLTDRVIFHRRRKLLWCPVFKAASTEWMHNFVTLEDANKVITLHYTSLWHRIIPIFFYSGKLSIFLRFGHIFCFSYRIKMTYLKNT